MNPRRLIPLALLWVAHDVAAEGQLCAQVITHGLNPATGNWAPFPTPCDIPDGWTGSATPPEGYAAPGGDCVEVAAELSFSLACAR